MRTIESNEELRTEKEAEADKAIRYKERTERRPRKQHVDKKE
jgi:hypothetical protein